VIICSCRAVTDRTVDAAIASGAGTVDDIAARCSAGGQCGGCWPTLQRLLDEHDGRRSLDADHAAA
jgi:bacterioferritin-associated ferredoxin